VRDYYSLEWRDEMIQDQGLPCDFAGIDPGDNPEEDEPKRCLECKSLFYGLLAICGPCDERLEREESHIDEIDAKRGK